MMKYRIKHSNCRRRGSTPSGFTLVEILVALAVMMLLLVIVLVPVNLGLDMFHVGKARSEVSQANQLVLDQLSRELRHAVFVFPNEEMPGITSKAPYPSASGNQPYYDAATTLRVSNTARIDFLLPAQSANGSVLIPPRAGNYIVTYYARRLNSADNYDPHTNPIVLWRAQYPYRNDNSASTNTGNLVNLGTRYAPVSSWLKQEKGEADLSQESDFDNDAVALASHTQLTPRDMALASPFSIASPRQTRAALTVSEPTHAEALLQPDSSFICDDADGDGKIDRVTMSLLLAKYDSIGAGGTDADGNGRSQQIRMTRTVELPNVK